MASARKKKLWVAALLCGTGIVFQLVPTGCQNYAISSALSAFNFCAVLNCEAGTYFDMCSPVALLQDCPTTTTTNP